jgi:hypothetical protein
VDGCCCCWPFGGCCVGCVCGVVDAAGAVVGVAAGGVLTGGVLDAAELSTVCVPSAGSMVGIQFFLRVWRELAAVERKHGRSHSVTRVRLCTQRQGC